MVGDNGLVPQAAKGEAFYCGHIVDILYSPALRRQKKGSDWLKFPSIDKESSHGQQDP
ncbi:MAG: hypothetical protein HOC74_13225 [Gemmatimonadetes bacterium]|jgi:hypothetical protein|nr:hypothetical protein [Gemmatimonadota bacterium]MBT7912318.1 hypothetical protein [Candidatus Bathyarchaeota archaeon]